MLITRNLPSFGSDGTVLILQTAFKIHNALRKKIIMYIKYTRHGE